MLTSSGSTGGGHGGGRGGGGDAKTIISPNTSFGDINNTFFHIWGVLGGPYVEPR